MGPEGRKSDALCHWVRWTPFQCFLDMLTKRAFYKNFILHYVLDLISFIWDPKEGNRTPSITGCGGHLFQCFLDISTKRFSTKTISFRMNFKMFIVLGRSKGGARTSSITWCGGHCFDVFSTAIGHILHRSIVHMSTSLRMR